MACRGFLECLLKLLNFLLTLAGLAMLGYGIYLFVEYKKSSSSSLSSLPVAGETALAELGRPLLMTVPLSSSIFDDLPKAWFIYLFIGVGVVLFVISCCGCIGTVTRNGCCLTCYAVLVILLILAQLGIAAFIYFDKSWEDDIPTDKTGYFDMIYDFVKEHWNILKWVALGVVILETTIATTVGKISIFCILVKPSCIVRSASWKNFTVIFYQTIWMFFASLWMKNIQALVFLLALMARAANRPVEYDSDDEFIVPRQQIRQPLLNRPPPPATGIPVVGALDQRPSRSDAWSTRMREKYGLDTTEFTYNPSEPGRLEQASIQPAERSRCTIM